MEVVERHQQSGALNCKANPLTLLAIIISKMKPQNFFTGVNMLKWIYSLWISIDPPSEFNRVVIGTPVDVHVGLQCQLPTVLLYPLIRSKPPLEELLPVIESMYCTHLSTCKFFTCFQYVNLQK